MDRVAAQALRIVGIVSTSVVIIVAALIFAIASACGLWSSSSSGDQGAKIIIGIGCPLVFIGGIFVIAKLAKGIARSSREFRGQVAAAGAPQSVAPQERNLAAEEEPLVHLRIAVGARILLSAAILTYHQVQPSGYPGGYARQMLVAAILGFLVYEAPNGFILWRIREKLDRFAVSLAVAYAAVSILWTIWSFMLYLRFLRYSHNQQLLVTWLLPIAAEIAVMITGWRARNAMPRSEDDGSTLLAAGGIAFVYLFLAYGLTSLFYRMRPF